MPGTAAADDAHHSTSESDESFNSRKSQINDLPRVTLFNFLSSTFQAPYYILKLKALHSLDLSPREEGSGSERYAASA